MAAYIIENVHLLKRKKLERTSLIIKNDYISAILPHTQNYQLMKMNASAYIMTPTYVLLDSEVSQLSSNIEMKEYYTDLIKKGCTTFLTHFTCNTERQLSSSLKKIQLKLINSPIDYITAIRIKPQQLTVSLIRMVKKEKIPAIFIEMDALDSLSTIPWGWIKESLFPYNCPLIPIFPLHTNEKEKMRLKQTWFEVMRQHRLPFIEDELTEKEVISNVNLQKIGISPVKSHIHQGGEVSYNLYRKSNEVNIIDENHLFLYHEDRLMTTVHKGAVIRAGKEVWYRPGFGEHVKIKVPQFFQEIR